MGHHLLSNTFWMLGGFGVRLGAQVIYFILVARVLGADSFGVFAGATALVAVLAPFATWGSGNILVKHASRDPSVFPAYWGAAVATSTLIGCALCGVALLGGTLALSPETAWRVVLPIALGDLIGTRFADLSAQAFQCREQLAGTASMWTLMSISRLSWALGFWAAPLPKTAENWALAYMASGILAGGAALLAVHRQLGWGPLSLQPMKNEWREGFYFAVSLAAQGAYNDIDKTLLVRLSPGPDAGAYAAAYRALDAVFIPIRALLYAGYGRFFQEGAKSLRHAAHFARLLLPWAAGYGLLAALFLVLSRPVLRILLGEGYDLTPVIILWLSPLVVFRAFHYLAADTLTGSGKQGTRTAVQVVLAGVNLGLNLWWIPDHGWRGAVWSSIVTDAFLALALWAIVIALTNSGRKGYGEAAAR